MTKVKKNDSTDQSNERTSEHALRTKWKRCLEDFERWYFRVGIKEKTLKGESFYWAWDQPLINKAANVEKGARALDIGCGIGWFVVDAIKRGADVSVGIDPCGTELRDAVKLARTNLVDEKALFIQGVGENIPIKENYFDVVVCAATLDHVLFPEKVIAEIRRVLKVGGRLVIRQNLSYQKLPIYSALMRVFPFLLRSGKGHGHHTYEFSLYGLHTLLQRHDFVLETYSTYGIFLPFVRRNILRKFTRWLTDKVPQFANAILAVYRVSNS